MTHDYQIRLPFTSSAQYYRIFDWLIDNSETWGTHGPDWAVWMDHPPYCEPFMVFTFKDQDRAALFKLSVNN